MQTRAELYETLNLSAYEALDASIVRTVRDDRHYLREQREQNVEGEDL